MVEPRRRWSRQRAFSFGRFEPLTGDVFAAGGIPTADSDNVFDIYKLSGADGTIAWHRTLEGTKGHEDEGFALAARPSGAVIAGGTLDNTGTKKDAVVYGLTSGGKSITLKKTFNFKIGELFKKKWLWGITAELTPAVPSAGEIGDLTREGAQLELRNRRRKRTPSSRCRRGTWHALGRAGRAKGFKYLDTDRAMGPCSKVLFEPGKFVATCKVLRTAPISLDEGSQGSFDVKLRLGNGDVYCWSTAGGEVVKDFGIAAPKRRGLFNAKNAPPPPATCE